MQTLTVHFSLQVKHKPNGGIAFPAFVLGAYVVKNDCNFFSLSVKKRPILALVFLLSDLD
jgi:hypothetical protein